MSRYYKALTRTYRPLGFEEIVGQTHIKKTLLNAIASQRLSHAYLFSGPRGVGKTTMARVLARVVNKVDNQIDGESLYAALNIIEIDAASNNSVEDVRLLRERIKIPPQNGAYKIYIIDEIHMLSSAAFNALLKTLEEPPKHIIFIFATTAPQKIPDTVLSRVQRFDFHRLNKKQLKEQIQKITHIEQIVIDNQSLDTIIQKSDGSLRDALGYLDQLNTYCNKHITYKQTSTILKITPTQTILNFLDYACNNNIVGAVGLIHDILHHGNDVKEFLHQFMHLLRDLLLLNSPNGFSFIDQSDDTIALYKSYKTQYEQEDILRILHVVNQQLLHPPGIVPDQLFLEGLFFQIIGMSKVKTIKQLIKKLPVDQHQSSIKSQVSNTEKKTKKENHNHYQLETPPSLPSLTKLPASSSSIFVGELSEDHSIPTIETQSPSKGDIYPSNISSELTPYQMNEYKHLCEKFPEIKQIRAIFSINPIFS